MPPIRRGARRIRWLVLPAAAAVAVALLLALPVAGWMTIPGRILTPALPGTALVPDASPTIFAEPTPAPRDPTGEPSPTPEPQALASPAPSAPRLVVPPTQAPRVLSAEPTRAVARFYQAVTAHQFGLAAALWSSRMQSLYPPPQYIDRRFSATQAIGLRSGRVVSLDGNVAVVSVDIVEVIGGQTRRWVGSWQLVHGQSGWLLNQPSLRAANPA